jgi:histidyl-tRNA synthetase
MRDLLPGDVSKKGVVIGVIRDLMTSYGYGEVETPTLEPLELVSAKVGEEIRHRMYVFQDLGGRSVALRPEVTSSIARLVATKLKTAAKPLRLAYIANCFRYDNPQLGRFREFWQAGFELIGSPYPEADGEVLSISNNFMKRLGFKDYHITIGHMNVVGGLLDEEGVSDDIKKTILSLIDKGRHDRAVSILSKKKASPRCLMTIKKLFRLRGRNAARVLHDGKVVMRDFLKSVKAIEELEEILGLLHEAKVIVNLGMARGLEYYTGMIFEVYVPGVKVALNGGGRYDHLIELFGGDKCPAVGCSIGIDRVVMAMEFKGLFEDWKRIMVKRPFTYIVSLDPKLNKVAIKLCEKLRGEGIPTQAEVMRRSLKRVLSDLSRKGVPIAILVTPSEAKENKFVVRFMVEGVQKILSSEKLIETVKSFHRVSSPFKDLSKCRG